MKHFLNYAWGEVFDDLHIGTLNGDLLQKHLQPVYQ